MAEHRGKKMLDIELRLHQRVVAREEGALLEWLQRVGCVVYCAALARTGSVADAERLTEVLFLELWHQPALFDPMDGPLSLQLIRRMSSHVVGVA